MEGSEILEPDSQKSTTNGYLSYNYEYEFGTEEEDEWDEETEYYDEKTKRKYYFSFQRRTAGVNLFGLQINNFAYVSNKIAKICSLWEEKSIKIAEIKLFFKPQHTSIGRKPYHSPAELLSSDIIMQVPTNVIQGKVLYQKIFISMENIFIFLFFQIFFSIWAMIRISAKWIHCRVL